MWVRWCRNNSDEHEPYQFESSAMTKDEFINLALSFPGTESTPHFERIGFKVIKKRMFAAYLEKDNTANIFLTLEEQTAFCKMRNDIYPVSNKWGEKGATTFVLEKMPKEIISEALLSSYNDIMKSCKQ